MTSDTLLFAAAQLKKYCDDRFCEEGCIFQDRNGSCRLDHLPEDWDIDDITGVIRDK